ncbi:MAG: hypothetical protein LBB84_00395 [Tannerellaceae bacterium]|jgi:hypothetical protein|nr:hypothetical protein [Tannerellaceae bacterium]
MEKRSKNWLPHSRQKVYEKVTEVTVPYLDANATRFGMEDTAVLGKWYKQEFSAKGYNPYVTAYAAWVNPETRTPIAIAAMREAEKVFLPYYRELYKLVKANPLVTDTDLEAMGFPSREADTPTPSPVAVDAPEFGVVPLVDHRLHIDYYPAGSKRKKGKPKGQHGAELRWAFSDTPIMNTNDLLNSVFDTDSPVVLDFSGDDQGRFVYFAMRWENTRGEKGPWSHIERALVP